MGFRDEKAVVRVPNVKRCNETVNRLNKTRQERFPNLAAEREAYEHTVRARALRSAYAPPASHALVRCRVCQVRAERKAEERARRKSELEVAREREAEAEQRSYSRIMGVRAVPQRCSALRQRSR